MDERKRKILYVITKGNWGGAQRYVFDLAAHLPKDRFETVVAIGDGTVLEKRLATQSIRTVKLQKLQETRRAGPQFTDIGAFFELLRLFRNERPDIIHLNSSRAALLGVFAVCGFQLLNFLTAKSYKLKAIFTAHGWPFKEDRPRVIKWLIYAATWFTVFLSHKTIVVSKQDEALGKRMRFVKRKISYIPIAMNPIEFLQREKAEEILFYPNVDSYITNSIRLVTIAELTKNKGLEYSIEMMKELEDRFPGTYTYTIFGEGEELNNLRDKSEKILNTKNQPVVRFRSIGTNIPSDLSTTASRYLKAFHIFILPSIKEGTPYVVLEASAAGLPIIATRVVESMASYIPNMYVVQSKSGAHLAEKVREISFNVEQKPHNTGYVFEKMLAATEKLYTDREHF